MRIEEFGEDQLVRAITRGFKASHPRILKAVGDDTSVTTEKSSRVLLATTDILIEGTHFMPSYTPARLLGRKALGISLSDIAAMGGVPLFFLVSISAQPSTPLAFLKNLYRGLKDRADEAGAALAGGNTARTSGPMTISTTVFGEAPRSTVVYRSGARDGDIICVTGTLGDSALGLKALSAKGASALRRRPFRKTVMRHLDPEPRLEAGRALAEKRLATAMMDISDGLIIDMGRLCLASGVGAVIEAGSIPLSPEMRRRARGRIDAHSLEPALSGGEDYELLFTSRPADSGKLQALSKKLGLDITPIGKISGKKRGVTVVGPGGKALRIKKTGFEHF